MWSQNTKTFLGSVPPDTPIQLTATQPARYLLSLHKQSIHNKISGFSDNFHQPLGGWLFLLCPMSIIKLHDWQSFYCLPFLQTTMLVICGTNVVRAKRAVYRRNISNSHSQSLSNACSSNSRGSKYCPPVYST